MDIDEIADHWEYVGTVVRRLNDLVEGVFSFDYRKLDAIAFSVNDCDRFAVPLLGYLQVNLHCLGPLKRCGVVYYDRPIAVFVGVDPDRACDLFQGLFHYTAGYLTRLPAPEEHVVADDLAAATADRVMAVILQQPVVSVVDKALRVLGAKQR